MTAVVTAAALSEHPLATHAVGECVGHLLEAGGSRPDLLTVFVTAPQAGALEDIVRATRQLLEPRTLIGTTAVSVLGGAREVEEHAAVTMFGAWAGGAPVTPVRLDAVPGPAGPELRGLDVLRGAVGTLLLVADPFSFPVDQAVDALGLLAPGLQVVGGMASAARQPGGNRVVLDGALHPGGAVGALLGGDLPVTTVVSQGCRPIGDPLTVTRAERNVLYELAGRPALERLMEVVDRLDERDRALAASGLHVGRVIDEHRVEFGRGDFLVRGVLGGDREAGSVVVGDVVDVGATVQFQVRDAASADEDLRTLMAGRARTGALVFTCNGRGSHLFGVPDHDAAVINEALDGAPVAGMFCAGELGPVGGRNFLHSFTAVTALIG
jgi:small ligand-binding sensory domain FIST